MFRQTGGGHGRKTWTRVFWPAALLLLTALLVLMPTNYNTAQAVSMLDAQSMDGATATSAKAYQVPVTLYVMSQCPDAKFCQNAIKPVLETLPSVATIRTEYIAKLAEEDKVQCMHGQAECDGNKQQLCLQHHLKPADNRKFYQALLCHSKGAVNNINHLQGCMTDAGVAAAVQAEVLKCIDGTLGTTLQVASAKKVATNSVQKSCTVFVADAKRCIRDGGVWYDCPGGSSTQAFVDSICDAYKAKTGKAAAECEAATGKGAAGAQAASSAA